MTDGLQPLLGGFGVQLAQVVDRDGKAAIADPLGAVGQDLHAQHRVAGNQFRRRVAQPVRIHPGAVELDVEVGGDAAELLIVVAAQPHRVLHGRQREGIAGVASAVVDGSPVSADSSSSERSRHQRRPRRHRRVLRQCGEVDVDALLTPPPRQRHHPDRIETGGDQVGVGVDIVGAHPEEFGDLLADGADRCTVVPATPTLSSKLVQAALTNLAEATLYSRHRTHLPGGVTPTHEHRFRPSAERPRRRVSCRSPPTVPTNTGGRATGPAAASTPSSTDAAAQWPDRTAVVDSGRRLHLRRIGRARRPDRVGTGRSRYRRGRPGAAAAAELLPVRRRAVRPAARGRRPGDVPAGSSLRRTQSLRRGQRRGRPRHCRPASPASTTGSSPRPW